MYPDIISGNNEYYLLIGGKIGGNSDNSFFSSIWKLFIENKK